MRSKFDPSSSRHLFETVKYLEAHKHLMNRIDVVKCPTLGKSTCSLNNYHSISKRHFFAFLPNYRKNRSKSLFIGLDIRKRIRRNDRDLYVKMLAVAHRTLSLLFCIIIPLTFKAAIHQMTLKYHQKLSESFNSNIKPTSVKPYPSFLVAQC